MYFYNLKPSVKYNTLSKRFYYVNQNKYDNLNNLS